MLTLENRTFIINKMINYKRILAMTISEQIWVTRSDMSVVGLTQRIGKFHQPFNPKIERKGSTIDMLEGIAGAVGSKFQRCFILPNGEKV